MVVDRQFSERYETLDAHALACPPQYETKMDDLVKYLISIAQNDEEKVRTIYRWVTDRIAYDFNSYKSGAKVNCDATNVLQSRSSVCSGYSHLFANLCKLANVECQCIVGYAKGYAYSIGNALKETNHEWNAVKIRGEWALVESTWGAGYVDGTKFVKLYDDSCFLQPPNTFIYRHLPKDEKWQLLDTPIGMDAYISMADVKNTFFHCGLSIKSHPYSSIVLKKSNTVHIEFVGNKHAIFMAHLIDSGTNKQMEHATFCQSKENVHVISCEVPQAGKSYALNVFCKLDSDSGSYHEAVKYTLKVDKSVTCTQHGFPTTYKDFMVRHCYLQSPLVGTLGKKKHHFAIHVPNAIKVAVIIGTSSKWHYLQKTHGDLFEGDIDLSAESLNVAVNTFCQASASASMTGIMAQIV